MNQRSLLHHPLVLTLARAFHDAEGYLAGEIIHANPGVTRG